MSSKTLILLAALTLITLVLGDSNRDYEDKMNRNIQLQASAYQVQINSIMNNPNSQGKRDKLKFELQADSGELQIKMLYANSSSNTQSTYKVKFRSIHEYINDEFNTTNTVSSLYFTKYNPIVCVKQVFNTNTTMFNCTVSTSDNIFSVQMFFSSTILNTHSFSMKPTSAKFTVFITNYPYKAPKSQLALVAVVVSNKQTREDSRSSENLSGFVPVPEKQVAFGRSVFFSWSLNATADGLEVPVNNQPLVSDPTDEPNAQKLVFTFGTSTQAKNIVWDPKLGANANVTYSSASSVKSTTVTFMFAILFSVVIFLLE